MGNNTSKHEFCHNCENERKIRMHSKVENMARLLLAAAVLFNLTACVGIRSIFFKSHDDGLVFHCTFDSAEKIAAPQKGTAGFFSAGEFVKGVEKNALHVPAFTSAAKFELEPATIGRQGTIEFWGKIDKENASLGSCGCPRFFQIISFEPFDEISQDWNGNNGAGGSGLTFRIGGLPAMASSLCGIRRYDYIENDIYGWHHYALVWNFNGGADGTANEMAKAAVYVDGRLVMVSYAQNWNGPALSNVKATLFLPDREDEMPSYLKTGYTIDEFKIWNCAKTDFEIAR